jgi:hypothetical protein
MQNEMTRSRSSRMKTENAIRKAPGGAEVTSVE